MSVEWLIDRSLNGQAVGLLVLTNNGGPFACVAVEKDQPALLENAKNAPRVRNQRLKQPVVEEGVLAQALVEIARPAPSGCAGRGNPGPGPGSHGQFLEFHGLVELPPSALDVFQVLRYELCALLSRSNSDTSSMYTNGNLTVNIDVYLLSYLYGCGERIRHRVFKDACI